MRVCTQINNSNLYGNYYNQSYLLGVSINNNIEPTLEEKIKYLKFQNIPVKEINGFYFFKEANAFYLIKEPMYDFLDTGFILKDNMEYKDGTVIIKCVETQEITKPYLFSPEKIYKMFKDVFPVLRQFFYEGFSLDDIVYSPKTDTYHILTKKIKYLLPRGNINIRLSNLYLNKSIYLYMGNEIKNFGDLNLILGGKYESYNSL